MNDNPLDSIPAFNRLSIRAVITRPGEDPSAALAAAGIVNPISIPIAITGSMDEAAALLGTGTMPHLAAVLEFIDRIDDGLNKTDPLGGYPRSPAANVSMASIAPQWMTASTSSRVR